MSAKAVAVTLQKHPLVNASLSDRGIEYKSNINVAVAVAMDDGGLITPVLKNADQTDLYTLSREWKGLVERAMCDLLEACPSSVEGRERAMDLGR